MLPRPGRTSAPGGPGEFGLAGYDRDGETARWAETTPTVVGWSYWSWKRAIDANPGPCALALPADWKAVAGWVTGGPGPAPSNETLAKGMRALVDFLKAERCVPDAKMMAALGARP